MRSEQIKAQYDAIKPSMDKAIANCMKQNPLPEIIEVHLRMPDDWACGSMVKYKLAVDAIITEHYETPTHTFKTVAYNSNNTIIATLIDKRYESMLDLVPEGGGPPNPN